MKRKHSPPPPSTSGVEDFTPSKSRNQEPDQLLPQPSKKQTDKTFHDLLDWQDSLWLPETEQEQPPPGVQTIPRPFPWAADHTGSKLHTLDYILYTLNINTVSANFQCNICNDVEKIEYNLVDKYMQVIHYIDKKGPAMGGLATNSWLFPTRPQCKKCNNKRRSLGQVITQTESSSINWLFLFVGKLIGCCKVNQLRGFCEQNKIECDGTKPRLVYLTYIGICKQLDPQANHDL